MRRLIGFLAILIVILFGLSFALLNASRVDVDYYFGTVGAPLSLALVVAVIIGAVIGVLTTLGMILGKQREVHRLRRRVKDTEKELNELRRLPLKDNH
ncbi:lipopolysaccharide assembly LapA domain-containing protein [Aquisalimonas sp.]|uniref:LapA family protein n=1 Tax=unclassified Aquisalimonas TaxID=2644645 RepID=UPI0025BAEBA5|nr:LapA family protein [Aquisalimonas sp.]